ncbi:MAG: hypothetical protein ABEN55_12695 [Bradymonadaceae bacterium]
MDLRRVWLGWLTIAVGCTAGCAPNDGGSDIQIVSGTDAAPDGEKTDADATGSDTRTGGDTSTRPELDTSTTRDGNADATTSGDSVSHDADAADSTGAGGPTWNSFAADFFDTYCVNCHGADDNDQDYRKYSEVKQDADTIRCGVAPTQLEGCSGPPQPAQFPVGNGPKPSDAERKKLVDWIEAGLPRE